MRRIMTVCLWSVCIALQGIGTALAATVDAAEPQVIHLTPFHGPNVAGLIGFGNCQWLYPLNEPKEKLLSEPAYGSAKRVYYAAVYGDAKDNIFTIVIDESDGTGRGFDTVYSDLNNDNRLDPKSEKFPLALSGLTSGTAQNVPMTLLVSVGGETIPYAFDFTAFAYKDSNNPVEKIHANCRNSTIMRGEALFGEKRCAVALADLNSNGLFNDYEQDIFEGDRFFADLNGDGSFQAESSAAESFPYAEYAKIGGEWYTLEASGAGGTVRIRRSDPAFGTIKAHADVAYVGLSSPKQFQGLELKDGQVSAIVGTYQLRTITLQKVDGKGQKWRTRGVYRPPGPRLTVEPKQAATLPEVSSFIVSVGVTATPTPDVIELEPKIVDANGGTFTTLRRNDERHEPPATLAIKDGSGKVVAEAKLQYG